MTRLGHPSPDPPLTDRHECPVNQPDSCKRRVPHSHLMCPQHWRMVPRDLQRAVLAEHAQACEDAIAAVERRAPRDLFSPDTPKET